MVLSWAGGRGPRPVMWRGSGQGGRSGGGLEGDLVTEDLEAGDEPTGFSFGVQAAGGDGVDAGRADGARDSRGGAAGARGPAESVCRGGTYAVLGVSFAAVGLVVAWHRPRNLIGWLML